MGSFFLCVLSESLMAMESAPLGAYLLGSRALTDEHDLLLVSLFYKSHQN